MSTISSENIISILRSEIENYEIESREHEVGTVIWVGDGIATIYGMEHAMYGEIVIFENGVKGMVQDIKQTEIGCIILGKDTGIREGMKVTRTKKRAGIPVGEHYLGRVVNALSAPIDGKGDIEADDYRPIECVHRESWIVNPFPFRWKPESCLLILCFRSAAVSVS